jgi:hypothetical protein
MFLKRTKTQWAITVTVAVVFLILGYVTERYLIR